MFLQRVKEQGITFEEFACLGRCNGLQISSYHADTVYALQNMHKWRTRTYALLMRMCPHLDGARYAHAAPKISSWRR